MVEDQAKQMDKLAQDVLTLNRNTLFVNLRFMDVALGQLTYHQSDEITLGTDGESLFYNPAYVLKCYKEEKEASVRDYLHIVLHCIYRHMFIDPEIDRNLWNFACDIAVESSIQDLKITSLSSQRERRQSSVIQSLREELHSLTAERIYNYYKRKNIESSEISLLSKLFSADDHKYWYASKEAPNEGTGTKPYLPPSKGNIDEHSLEQKWNSLEQKWKGISEQIQQGLETFFRSQEDKAGSMMQNLLEVNREKYDYQKFLRKFAVLGEVMQIDPDEFDYIFYTYGLKLYRNIPLIEPLEYKMAKRIREFVIAIDTSGSVSGELVQSFINKTYNILQETESFFSKINMHIIQCDAEIQEDVKIKHKYNFDSYINTMQIRGNGGTDFRPVFNLVDELIKKKEFKNLKGLIYFTDGYGVFPARKPDYLTAFVFLEDEYKNPDVPPWAIKLILPKEDVY